MINIDKKIRYVAVDWAGSILPATSNGSATRSNEEAAAAKYLRCPAEWLDMDDEYMVNIWLIMG